MSDARCTIGQINIVAVRFDETLKFYRALGLDIPDAKTQPPGALHAPANVGAGTPFALDNQHLARIYNAAQRSGRGSSVLISVYFDTRAAVDDTYAKLVAAGHAGRQRPYDAFWGARFAIVADPEGNDVGLMSPVDDAFVSWPPVDAPA
jgi:uncharacterized glyoxalase superfamily protein PhnB